MLSSFCCKSLIWSLIGDNIEDFILLKEDSVFRGREYSVFRIGSVLWWMVEF